MPVYGVRIWIRIFVFSAVSLFLFGGSMARHAFDVKAPYLREWRMGGSRAGARHYRVVFSRNENGREKVYNHNRLLGYMHRSMIPRKYRRLTREADAYELARAVCRRYGDGEPLRLYMARPTRKGYEWIYRGQSDACADIGNSR